MTEQPLPQHAEDDRTDVPAAALDAPAPTETGTPVVPEPVAPEAVAPETVVSEPAAEPEPAAQPESEPAGESEPAAEPEPVAARSGSVTESESEPVAESRPAAESELEPEPEPASPELAAADEQPPAPEAAPEPVSPEPVTPEPVTPEATREPVARESVVSEPAAPELTAAAAPTSAPTAPTPAPTAPTPAPAVPTPAPVPRPAPRPPLPGRRPAARPAVTPVPPVDAHDAAEAAAWGRVDPDGTVWVRESTGERSVGQYPGADTQEALAFYVRRFLDLQAQVALFEARLPQLPTKEIDQTLRTLRESLEAPTAVGDIDGLRARVDALAARAAERRKELQAEREAAKNQALAERTAIVEQAERIAGTDPARIQWRSSGEELRALLDRWKAAQRSGPRIDRPKEDELWKRFSHARTTFDRHRRQFFAELDAVQAQAKAVKAALVERAEALSASTDWGATSAAFRSLMDEWKAAGRASRKDDDALWARFRAAQQRFFDARNEQNAQVDAEYTKNLEAKLELLEKAEALLPPTDAAAAKAALRRIQDAWDEIGKVPRADVQRVEARMRAVEQAVRDADDARWRREDPEKKARAEGVSAQLQEAIAALEKDVADAEAAGDERALAQAREALDARRAWLDQVLRAAGGR